MTRCLLCNRKTEGEYCPACEPPPSDNTFRGGARCQEASVLSREHYFPCSVPAVAIVYHAKDRRAYYMCGPCASHNVCNRGGRLLAQKNSPVQGKPGKP